MRIFFNISLVIVMLVVVGCGKQRPPVFPGAEWSVVAPSDREMDGDVLERELAALGPEAGNVVIVRGGEVIHMSGAVEQAMPLYSASKSIVSLLCGRLFQEGRADLETELPVEVMEENPVIRDFLSMTSSFELDPATPGTHYAYNNRAYHFLGQYLRDNYFAGKEPWDILQQELMARVEGQDAVDFGGQWGGWGGGFAMSARDLARLGLLVLRDGEWADEQLIPAEFVEQLYRSQVPENAEAGTDRGPNDEWNQEHFTRRLKESYSYGWWLGSMRDGVARHIRMSGRGGTFLMVHPELDLVISVTNDKPNDAPDAGSYLKAVQAALKK